MDRESRLRATFPNSQLWKLIDLCEAEKERKERMKYITEFDFEGLVYRVDGYAAFMQDKIVLPDHRLLSVTTWTERFSIDNPPRPVTYADTGITIEQFVVEKGQKLANAIPVAELVG